MSKLIDPKYISGAMTTDSELSVEASSRINADTTLQNNINAETAARLTADQHSKITNSTTFTTSSVTDVMITGFTLTPAAGTYAIFYSSMATIATNNALLRSSIYKAGVLIADSTRVNQAGGANSNCSNQSMTTAQFNGSQTCDVRVRSSSGSVSILDRTLFMQRIGN